MPALVPIWIGSWYAYRMGFTLNNKFFLTNEKQYKEIRTSPFAHNEQTVSLGNIEDASYTQREYGTILTTVRSV